MYWVMYNRKETNSMSLVLQETRGNKTVKIFRDEWAHNPREEYDHLFTFACRTNREFSLDENLTNEELKDIAENDDLIKFPLYAYVHSGVVFNMSGFHCPWDSGQTGFIYASKEKIKKEMNWKVITKKRMKQLESIARGELEEFNAYISGAVYGFQTIINKGKCSDCGTDKIEDGDSCWGFIGIEPEQLLKDVFEGRV